MDIEASSLQNSTGGYSRLTHKDHPMTKGVSLISFRTSFAGLRLYKPQVKLQWSHLQLGKQAPAKVSNSPDKDKPPAQETTFLLMYPGTRSHEANLSQTLLPSAPDARALHGPSLSATR